MNDTSIQNSDARAALRREIHETFLAAVPDYVQLYNGEASLDGYYTPMQLRAVAAAIEAYSTLLDERGIEAA